MQKNEQEAGTGDGLTVASLEGSTDGNGIGDIPDAGDGRRDDVGSGDGVASVGVDDGKDGEDDPDTMSSDSMRKTKSPISPYTKTI